MRAGGGERIAATSGGISRVMQRVDCKPMIVGIQHRGSADFDQWHDAVGLFHLSFGERGRRVRHFLTRLGFGAFFGSVHIATFPVKIK